LKKISSQTSTYSIPEENSNSFEIQDHQSWLIFVSENELTQTNLLELLKKIILALNLTWDHDSKIIAYQPNSYFKFNQISNSTVKCILGFGIAPSQIGLQGFEKKHHVYTASNKTILFADLLVNYTNDASKKSLWKALQEANNF